MNPGDLVEVAVERPAHGGFGVGTTTQDSRICLVQGGIPGDVLRVRLTRAKKTFYQGEIAEVLRPAEARVEQRCEAAKRGAGCCDFGTVHPVAELALKVSIVKDQLRRLARDAKLPDSGCEPHELPPHTGWRTRWRLGVDSEGRAGLRQQGGTRVVWEHQCVQAPDGLLDGIVGAGAQRFTPGSEVLVALGGDGVRTVCQVRKAPRGRRSERAYQHIEGPELVSESVLGVRYRLPAAAFWQAHRAAPAAYVTLAAEWLSSALHSTSGSGVGWDLYGGVGLFVPPLIDALRTATAPNLTAVHSVETSPTAARDGQRALRDLPVQFHRADVARLVGSLPAPQAVVLDPPRQGAGVGVISAVAAAGPRAILHVGCDPATFARDFGCWYEHGYVCTRLAVVNAFPGTHHSESFGLFEPIHLGYEGHKAALSRNGG